MEKIKVYIAGPYSSNPEDNTEKAINYCNELLNNGFIPFCPHLSHYLHKWHPRDWKEWIEYDLEWLDVCDCLYRIPGESKGADIEEECAKGLGIPIFYNLKQLINHELR